MDVIDIERRQRGDGGLLERDEVLLRQHFAGLDHDFSGRLVDQALGHVAPHELFVADQEILEPVALELGHHPGRQFDAGRGDGFSGARIYQVGHRLDAAHALGNELRFPTVLVTRVLDGVVEESEDVLGRHAEREQERRHGKLAPAVDADVDDILGVELEVEPRAAIGNDAGGEQELARRMRFPLVVVEEDAWRAMHLADDDALGAVDDEGAVAGHSRQIAHVDVLFLDIEDRLGLGIGIDLEDDEPQRDLEGRGVGHASLLTLLDVVLGLFELVLDELQGRGPGEVGDREDRADYALQTEVPACLGRHAAL